MYQHHLNGDGASHPAPPGMLADRLPPQNLEAERGVLGSVLVDPAVMGDVADLLAPGDFYRADHETLWREFLSAHADGLTIDIVLVGERLDRSGSLGRPAHEVLSEMSQAVPHAANARYYAEIVRQKAASRALVEAANETLREAYSHGFTADELLESAERRVLAISDAAAAGETVRIDAVMPAVMDAIGRRAAGEVTGVASGLADLDEVTTGFQPGNLIYLAGRTSMGKTSLALNVVDHVAVNMNAPVLLVTLEMSRAEIGERLLVARSGVDGQRVRSGSLSHADHRSLAVADAKIRRARLFIDDTAGRTAAQVAANARRYHKRESVEMVVIDLINHVAGEDPRESRREQMCVISRRFKAMARELSVPVVVLAQLNRGPDNREGNRPRKSDLKECGNLEEDADLVLLLHRPEYYDPNDAPGQAVVIVDKNRNGPTRDVNVAFVRHLMRFDNLARGAPFD